MKHGCFPYRGISRGIADFGDSLCVASLYPSTRIADILRNFSVTGVLPQTGRAALPADIIFGDFDFNTLRSMLDDAAAQGITEEEFLKSLKVGLDSAPGASPVDDASADKPAEAGQAPASEPATV